MKGISKNDWVGAFPVIKLLLSIDFFDKILTLTFFLITILK